MASALSVAGSGRRVVAQWMWLKAGSRRKAGVALPCAQEMLQLLPGRIFRRAQEPRHREGAAGIGPGAGGLQRLVAQPAAQEAGHEGVAGAEHVVDLDRKAGPGHAFLETNRNGAGKDDAAHRAALADERRGRERPDGAQGREGILRSAEDVQLLFRADDEVAIGHDRLQVRRHRVGADVALLAGAVAGEAPQVRAVIDVEGDAPAGGLGGRDRLAAHGVDGGRRQMRARDADRLGGGDEGLVDILHGQRHVGAVLAVEDEREALVVADPESDERGEPVRIGLDAGDGDALADQLLADEAAEGLVADGGDHGALEPEPRRADRRVGRAAADRLGERRHVLEPPADLLAVEIDRRAADGDDVEDRRGHAVSPTISAVAEIASCCSSREGSTCVGCGADS